MPERSRKLPDPSNGGPSTRIATEETQDTKNPHAEALGRLGGLKGGPARAAKLTDEERRSIARRAAQARWSKDDAADEPAGPTTRLDAPGGPLFRTAEERYRALVEQIPAVVYIDALDEAGTTVYISPQVEDLLGYPLADWHDNPGIWFETLHPEDRDAVFEDYMRDRELGEPWTMEYRMVARDGRVVWIREDGIVLRADDGTPLAVQGVMFDVTQQKEVEQRLLDADRTKDALLHAVSHDLRGPLSAVLGAATLMTSDEIDVSADDRVQLLEGLAASARKMDRIIANLLDMDRLDRGLIVPRTQPVDVGELVRSVVGETPLPAGRAVATDVPADPVRVPADRGLLERIVENLVLNALKHTPKRSEVWARARSDAGGALILVDDSGPGVPAESRERIFLPFERDAEEYVTGAGIGLSLVARFAQLHGGRAWVTEREGGGASFRVFLPGDSS